MDVIVKIIFLYFKMSNIFKKSISVIFTLGIFLVDNSIFFFEFLSATIRQFSILFFFINLKNSFVLDILVVKSLNMLY